MPAAPPSTVPGRMPGSGWVRGRGALLAVCLAAALVCPSAPAADEVRITTLIDDLPGVGPLAVSPNGQTVHCLDQVRRAVIAFDPFAPTRRRDVVAAAAEGQPVPVAIGCLPGEVLAIIGRSGDEWSLRTFRIRPGEATDPANPLQSMRLGTAAAAAPTVRLVVSQTRDWLAVVGLPEPLPPVLRIVFAGAGMRLLAQDGRPGIAADRLPVAAVVSPADELVLLEQSRATAAEVTFHAGNGAELLRLDTGLPQVRDAAFSRGDGTLWVLGGAADSAARPEGLWRLDAVMQDGRQAVRPAFVARLVDPRSIVAVSEQSVVAALAGSIVRIDPVGKGIRSGKDEEQETP